VHLLGGVGEVEVGAEGADEPDRGGRVDIREHRRGGLAVRSDQVPDLLDQVEQRRALLAYERPAEQDAQLADVASQIGLRVGLEREATRRQSVHQS
jgi:hypothetical protein